MSERFRQGKQIELERLTAKQSMASPIAMIKISTKFTDLIDFKNYTKIAQIYGLNRDWRKESS
jgi:hypothetical protein